MINLSTCLMRITPCTFLSCDNARRVTPCAISAYILSICPIIIDQVNVRNVCLIALTHSHVEETAYVITFVLERERISLNDEKCMVTSFLWWIQAWQVRICNASVGSTRQTNITTDIKMSNNTDEFHVEKQIFIIIVIEYLSEVRWYRDRSIIIVNRTSDASLVTGIGSLLSHHLICLVHSVEEILTLMDCFCTI
jgi:hypothetical protein